MAGLGAFVQGAAQGYSFGTNIKDRKRRQKIEDTQLEREAERHGWAGENHELNTEISKHNLNTSRSNQAYTQKERDRAEAERQRNAEIFLETEKAYEQKYGAPPTSRGVIPEGEEVDGTPVVSSQGADPALEGGMGADELAAVRASRANVGQGAQQPVVPGADGVTVNPRVARGIVRDAPMDPRGQVIDQRPDMRGQGGPMPQINADGVPVNVPRTGGDPRDAEAARMATIQRQRQEAQRGPVAPPNPGPAVQGDVRGQQAQMVQNPGRMGGYMDQDQTQMQPSRADAQPRSILPPQMQAPEGPDVPNVPGRPAVPAGSPPSVEAASAATQDTAAKTVPKTNSKGVTKATPAQEERASKTFLEFYAETAGPKVVREYLRQGNVEKAQAFTEWSEMVETKSMMKSWSKAVFAGSINDEDGVLEHLSDTFNKIDDGYEVIKGESGFERDKEGNTVGLNLMIKNTKTGETFVREFEDQGDLIEQGIYALAPENVFELLYEQTLAARQLEAGNSGRKIIDDRKDDIVAEAGRLRKQFSEQTMYGGQDQTMPTDDELFAMARDNISRAESLAAGRGSQAVAPQPVPDWGG